ncbi:biotin/lipoyl-containing protein [Lacunimicrobium album]
MPQPLDHWEPIHVPVLDVPADIPITVSLWYLDPGSQIREGERVAELSFPGMILEVYSPTEGRLALINRHPGKQVVTGDVLGWVEPG